MERGAARSSKWSFARQSRRRAKASGFRFGWAKADARNPARRRNAAAREARAGVLAFLDDDATAEPGWLAAGARACETADVVGGPDPGPRDAPYGERLSDLLLATPAIGSGIPAHERNPRGGPVRSAHDVALCNLFVRRETFERLDGFDESFGYIGEDTDFVRRALDIGARVVLDPSVRVRHRRRAFPGPYLAQRWRYRVKTGRLLVERPGLHARGRVAAFLDGGVCGHGRRSALRWTVPAAGRRGRTRSPPGRCPFRSGGATSRSFRRCRSPSPPTTRRTSRDS